jgi:hypothetical protein
MRKLPIFVNNKRIRDFGFKSKVDYANLIKIKKSIKEVRILEDGVLIIPKYTKKQHYEVLKNDKY